jgi:hypothetical protein
LFSPRPLGSVIAAERGRFLRTMTSIPSGQGKASRR